MSECHSLALSAGQKQRWALADPETRRRQTEAATLARHAQFEAAVDTALPGLDPEERARRIAALKSAHYTRIRAARLKRTPERKTHNPGIDALAAELFASEK